MTVPLIDLDAAMGDRPLRSGITAAVAAVLPHLPAGGSVHITVQVSPDMVLGLGGTNGIHALEAAIASDLSAAVAESDPTATCGVSFDEVFEATTVHIRFRLRGPDCRPVAVRFAHTRRPVDANLYAARSRQEVPPP